MKVIILVHNFSSSLNAVFMNFNVKIMLNHIQYNVV